MICLFVVPFFFPSHEYIYIGTIGKALGRQGEKVTYALKLMKKEYHHYQQFLLIQEDEENKIRKGTTLPKSPSIKQYSNSNLKNSNVTSTPNVFSTMKQSVERYNQYRKDAIQARWELMVHRQAIGCIVNNQQYVMEHYPIPEAIILPIQYSSNCTNNKDHPDSGSSSVQQQPQQPIKKKKFTDQLDWWQTIGRWK